MTEILQEKIDSHKRILNLQKSRAKYSAGQKH
jgi:hypothetical protein